MTANPKSQENQRSAQESSLFNANPPYFQVSKSSEV